MSEQTPEAPATPQEGAAPEAGQPQTFDAEYVANLRKEAAKYRTEAKAATAEIEKARAASMSEAEKAVAEAEKRGESKASERFAARLVDESFRAATVGRTLTPDALLSFDRKAFITDDGDVDRDSLVKWVETNASQAEAPRSPSFDGGPRTTAPAPVGMTGLIRKAAGRA